MAANPYYQLESYRDGDIVARCGDEGRELYVVHSGRVVLSRGDGAGGTLEITLERGGFFGELSLFQGVPRQETARAVGPTKLLVLEPGSLLLKIRRDPSFAFAMLQQTTHRVVALEEELSRRERPAARPAAPAQLEATLPPSSRNAEARAAAMARPRSPGGEARE